MSKVKKLPVPEKLSKKKLSKVVFEKLSGSLTDFQLNEKKLETRLDKVSKRLAADIVKLLKKETPKTDKTARRKKALKKEEVAVAE
jgi:ribosomal protein S17E